jgi:polyisoprenoid-binding protein YceI
MPWAKYTGNGMNRIVQSSGSFLLAALLAVVMVSSAIAAERTYVVDAAQSSVVIHVGKSGAFSFAGHEHEVTTSRFEGVVVADPDDVSRCSVSLTFPAAALKVTGKGEPPEDVPKVQEIMLGPKVLDVARFPEVIFRSRQVSGRRTAEGAYELQVAGDLSLHGVTRPLTLPLRVEIAPGRLTAAGRAVIRHTDFGMTPVSAAGGTVKVKNEIPIDFRIVAHGP